MKLNLDWSHWLYSLLGAFISGGAGAVTASLVAMGITPDRYDLGVNLGNTLKMMGGCFILNGVIGSVLLLKAKPLPDIETEVKETHTIVKEPLKTTTIEEKTTTKTPTSSGSVDQPSI